MSFGLIDTFQKLKKDNFEKFHTKIGIVKSLDDRENKNRILVTLADEELEVWAMVMTNYVGENKGYVKYPDIGTPCVVDFFDGDLQRPVILGYIYDRGRHKSVLPLTKDNKKELLVTKSDVKIESTNEPDKFLFNVKTKKGHEFIYSEEEEKIRLKNQDGTVELSIDFKNSEIIINAKKVIIKGENDSVTFEDKKSFKFDSSGGKFEVSSNDTLINSKNSVDIKTNSGKVILNGTGGLDVQTSANMTIKGSMVQIN